MSSATPALIAAAAGVGFGHAILPDHWVPLAVVGRTRRYPLTKIARLSGLAGVAHVLISILLGAVIIAVGLQFRSTIQSAQDTIIGCLLIATGLGFGAFELLGPGHTHDHPHAHGHGHGHGQDGYDHDHDRDHDHGNDHDRDHDHGNDEDRDHDHDQGHRDHQDRDHDHDQGHRDHLEQRGVRGLAAIMVPFGAAASPDLTILPVFLAATAAGAATAIGALVIFAVVTIATIVGLTLTAAKGGYQIRGQWLERWGNALTAIVLIVIGLLVLTSAI